MDRLLLILSMVVQHDPFRRACGRDTV